MGKAFTTSTRKSDGKPRKLRRATHPQAVWRQARQIMEHRRGHGLRDGELVSHEGRTLVNTPKNIKVISKSQHEKQHHGHHERGKKPTEPYLKNKKRNK